MWWRLVCLMIFWKELQAVSPYNGPEQAGVVSTCSKYSLCWCCLGGRGSFLAGLVRYEPRERRNTGVSRHGDNLHDHVAHNGSEGGNIEEWAEPGADSPSRPWNSADEQRSLIKAVSIFPINCILAKEMGFGEQCVRRLSAFGGKFIMWLKTIIWTKKGCSSEVWISSVIKWLVMICFVCM